MWKVFFLFHNWRTIHDLLNQLINNTLCLQMIKRACNWAKSGFTTGGTKKCGWYVYYEVFRTDYDFNNMAVWKRVK